MLTQLYAILMAGLCSALIACAPPAQTPDPPARESASQQETLVMLVGETEFQIVLHDNATAQALQERLPLTLTMEELNGNEKFYRFSEPLPADAEAVGSISAGDVMLYQDHFLVLFYESHSTGYHYTPIGRIADADALAAAVGRGSVTVTLGD